MSFQSVDVWRKHLVTGNERRLRLLTAALDVADNWMNLRKSA
ncbi:hypothetical protein [Pseudomonas extremaustralis]|jgi:hypothetical protein